VAGQGDVIKLRIDGISAGETQAGIRDFCRSFGRVSRVQIESNSEGDYWALVELREAERYEELWVGWLNPLKIDGWTVRVEKLRTFQGKLQME
jgi:hypothetical protein